MQSFGQRGDDDDLYEDVLPPPVATEPSYLDALPSELASLVVVDVARADVAALGRLTRTLPRAAAIAASTPVRLPWAPWAPMVRLSEAARLSEALGARGLDDAGARARRCVLLAYIDWVAADASLDVPTAAMAARALVAAAQTMDEPNLLRLVAGSDDDDQRPCRVADAAALPVSGLGAPFMPSSAPCAGRIVHTVDSATLERLVEASLSSRTGRIDGRALVRWMDDAIDARARQRCPGAFVAAPAAMPRFSDLFAVDAARIAFDNDGLSYLVGRLRPRW